MIGIIAKEADKEIVKEFFELFKTPWEFYQSKKSYQVVIFNGTDVRNVEAHLKIIFGTHQSELDSEFCRIKQKRSKLILQSGDNQYPIYGEFMTFPAEHEKFITNRDMDEVVGVDITLNGNRVLRVGYDLFDEVKFLLTKGQPPKYAQFPTLDIHISNLRNWIIESGLSLVEIPPIPFGYKFIVCLTHDVDFAGIRNHKLDRTLFGFIYRATIGSIIRFFQSKLSFYKLFKNWVSVLSLPLIYLGVVKDFWIQFRRYITIEKDFGSTFFVVPFKNKSGKGLGYDTPKNRAIKYDINCLRDEINDLIKEGFEIGVHGIDAWIDSKIGKKEFEKVELITGCPNLGIRMHWLYFTEDSPSLVENAGYFYDSTFGYNGTVGFRAGTLQPFRPLGTKELIEVPLNIQDTALFYPDRMNLTESDALILIRILIDLATRYGGVLTFNWHHRSIAPERLCSEFYMKILEELRSRSVKFLPASSLVKWFNKRRSITFEKIEVNKTKVKVKIGTNDQENSCEMLIRIYKSPLRFEKNGLQGEDSPVLVDYPLYNTSEFEFNL